MNGIAEYFSNIPSAHRAIILVGGIAFFWIWESALPLVRFDYRKWRHALVNLFFTATTILVNFGLAFLLLMTSEWAQGRHIGLLHAVVPAADLDATVDRTLHFWRKGGPVAQREAKALALRMAGMTPESAERVDRDNAALIARLRVSPEGQQGLTAFLGKSAPPWTL